MRLERDPKHHIKKLLGNVTIGKFCYRFRYQAAFSVFESYQLNGCLVPDSNFDFHVSGQPIIVSIATLFRLGNPLYFSSALSPQFVDFAHVIAWSTCFFQTAKCLAHTLKVPLHGLSENST